MKSKTVGFLALCIKYDRLSSNVFLTMWSNECMKCASCENHKHYECIDCQNDHKTELCDCECHKTMHEHKN